MPNEVKKLEDGKVEVTLESGEKFAGDPFEVLNKMGDAHVSTKRWAQNIKAENENLKAQRINPPEPVQQVQQTATNGNADELALQNYLLDQHAKALGYKNGSEYQEEVQRIKATSEQTANNQVAESFMLACPEFPSTPESIDKLTAKIDQFGWKYDQQSLMAAHLMCVREGAYQPLSAQEVNASWAHNMQQASQPQQPGGPTIPPRPPQGNAPGGNDNTNPWAMSTDELRKQVLQQGGLGKALMNLKPGESLEA